MIGPILLPLVLAVAGWFTADWAGAVSGFGVGLLVSVAVAAAAAWWARTIGMILEPADALAEAPRPPLFGRLCDWVYVRTIR